MEQAPDLNQLSEQQLRELAGNLLAEVQQKDQTIERIERQNNQYKRQNEQYKHELAILRRHQFARKSEILNAQQRSLLDDWSRKTWQALKKRSGNNRPPHPRQSPNNNPNASPCRQSCREP